MDLSTYAPLAGFVLASALAAAPGIVFRPGAWYAGLAKPSWCPPSWLFGPVWTLLYVMIAVAGWLVWRADGFGLPLALFAVQLVLNALWSCLFFGLRRPDLAFADIVALCLAIAATIAAFVPVSGLAAALLVPYGLWVGFALLLNLSVWRLNAR